MYIDATTPSCLYNLPQKVSKHNLMIQKVQDASMETMTIPNAGNLRSIYVLHDSLIYVGGDQGTLATSKNGAEIGRRQILQMLKDWIFAQCAL